MKFHIKLIYLLISATLHWHFSFSQCNRMQDSVALVTLHNSTMGNYWNNIWNLNSTIDTWQGVKLNSNGCVTHLNLTNNNLNGFLPNEIGSLSALRFLYLSKNNIKGNIPSELENLNELIILDLSYNKLNGNIPPELGNMDNLYWLVLNNNLLTGEIPAHLSKLSQLSNLALYQNELSGEIPPELSNLQNLSDLFLGFNNLTGEIPSSLATMPNLNNLYVANNALSGCYAPELTILCEFGTNTTISDGNNFNVSWNEFCNFNIGACGGVNCVEVISLTDFLTENIYQAEQIINASSIIPASREILFIAGKEIQLNLGFQTQYNATFNAIIQPCE